MNLFRSLIDMIYPPRCFICDGFLLRGPPTPEHGGVHICEICLKDFQRLASPLCPVCGKPFFSGLPEDHWCEDCLRKRPLFEALLAPYLYEGSLMKAIHRFKYGSKGFIASSLGPLLGAFAKDRLKNPDDLLVMPVPLHPKRLRQRGFNQTLLLARHLVRHLPVELDFFNLRRIRHTAPQIGLGKDERRKNVRGAFRLSTPKTVRGRAILLLDDVATTGNTLNECARVLMKAGAERVLCLVLARAANP